MLIFRPSPRKQHVQAITPQQMWQWSGKGSATPTQVSYLMIQIIPTGAYCVLKVG
jgi:hypothetical protein